MRHQPTLRLASCLLAVSALTGCGDEEMSPEDVEMAKTRTQTDMRSIATALESYSVDDQAGEYPTVSGIEKLAEVLEPTYLDEVPRTDGWGRPYDYSSQGSTYMVFSAGPDGEVATGDDLKIETGRANF